MVPLKGLVVVIRRSSASRSRSSRTSHRTPKPRAHTVSLPQTPRYAAARTPEGAASRRASLHVPASSSPLTVLVAEDNESNLEMMTDFLWSAGYKVIVARNGMEALDRFTAEAPALVLMDIQMPEMDGLEAIRRIRAGAFDGEGDVDRECLSRVPIFALTALAMPGDDERCLEAGANAYLSKPVSLRKLKEMIVAELEAQPL